MNPTAVSLEQHGVPIEPVETARQVPLIVDRLSDDNLRQSSHKTPIVIHTPKRSIETRRRNLEYVRVIDHVLHVENRAHLMAHPLAVLDADARIRMARHGPRSVGDGPIEIDPQDPSARFAPVLYVEDFQVIGPRDSLSDGSYPVEGIHFLDRGAPTPTKRVVCGAPRPRATSRILWNRGPLPPQHPNAAAALGTPPRSASFAGPRPPRGPTRPLKQKSGHRPTSVDRTSVALSLYHTGSNHNNVPTPLFELRRARRPASANATAVRRPSSRKATVVRRSFSEGGSFSEG